MNSHLPENFRAFSLTQKYISIALVLLTLVVSASLAMSYRQEIEVFKNSHSDTVYNDDEIKVVELYLVESNLGYGGILHKYYNFLDTLDPRKITMALGQSEKVRGHLVTLSDLAGPEELVHINTIFKALIKYNQFFVAARVRLETGGDVADLIDMHPIPEDDIVAAVKTLRTKWGREFQVEQQKKSQALDHALWYIYGAFLAASAIALLVFGLWYKFRHVYQTAIRASSELESSVEEYRTLVTNTNDGIIYINTKGFITFINPAACKMFGYSKGELLGESVNRLMSYEEQKFPDEYLISSESHAPRGMNQGGRDLEAKRKNGETFHISLNVSALVINGEDHFATIIRDTSEKAEAENELRELYEDAPNAYLTLQMNTGVIIRHNKALTKLLGYSSEELSGHSILDFKSHIGNEEDIKATQHWEGFFKGNPLTNVETQFVKKTGEVLWISVTAIPHFGVDGGLFDGRVTFVDITEIKETAIRLESATKQADSSNEAKTRFLSNMSHELRTPLNSILGHSQLLMNSKRHPLGERQLKQVNSIYNSGAHLLSLIDEVLDLAKVESGTDHQSVEVVNLSFVIKDVMGLAEPLPDRFGNNVTFHTDFMSDECFLMADRTRFCQIFLNLLSNAVKYNEENGEVHVKTSLSSSAGFCRIEVTDTGIGISTDKLDQVFSPFKRLGAEMTQVEGTGIGLYLTKLIIENMGGQIGLFPGAEQGTTFWVEFPMIQPQASSQGEARGRLGKYPNVGSENKVILYIEDNPENIVFMEALVDELDEVALITAVDGAYGLVMANLINPDCILLDINLPDIDGVKVMQRLKNSDNTKNIPVAVVTANIDPITEEVMKGLGCLAYLRKPIILEDLFKFFEKSFGEGLRK